MLAFLRLSFRLLYGQNTLFTDQFYSYFLYFISPDQKYFCLNKELAKNGHQQNIKNNDILKYQRLLARRMTRKTSKLALRFWKNLETPSQEASLSFCFLDVYLRQSIQEWTK